MGCNPCTLESFLYLRAGISCILEIILHYGVGVDLPAHLLAEACGAGAFLQLLNLPVDFHQQRAGDITAGYHPNQFLVLVEHREPMVAEAVEVAYCKRNRHIILEDDEVTRHVVLRLFLYISFIECLDDVIHAYNPYQSLADYNGKTCHLFFAHDVLNLPERGFLAGGNKIGGHDILHLQSIDQFKDHIRRGDGIDGYLLHRLSIQQLCMRAKKGWLSVSCFPTAKT